MSLLTIPVPTSIESLIAAMERLHRPKGPYVTARAPTGESFLIFVPTGVLIDGDEIGCIYLSPEAAIQAYWRSFIQMSHGSPGTRIWWRVKPELAVRRRRKHGWEAADDAEPVLAASYMIHSRFLLSNKPIISRPFEEECLGTHKSTAGKAQPQSGDDGREALQAQPA